MGWWVGGVVGRLVDRLVGWWAGGSVGRSVGLLFVVLFALRVPRAVTRLTVYRGLEVCL